VPSRCQFTERSLWLVTKGTSLLCVRDLDLGSLAMPSPRRFPPPWTIEELNDAYFVVSDANGQKLGYFYFEEEAGRRSAAKLVVVNLDEQTVS